MGGHGGGRATIGLLRRPWPLAILIGLAAEVLFVARLGTPSKLVFDETYYVPAARALLALSAPVNNEHPLLGKELIALGIALFGDDAFGHRFLSTWAASATVTALFAILYLHHRRLRVAAVGAVLAIVNFALFVQARIGMLDGFEAAFLTSGVAALLWSARAPSERVLARWILGAALLGLAAACKWAAIPFLGYAALAFIGVRLADARAAGRPPAALFEIEEGLLWPGLAAGAAFAWLFGMAAAVYFATFLPAFFYDTDPLTLAALLPLQARMFAELTGPSAPHIYKSSWLSWPLDIRPVWYYYGAVDGGWRGVLMIGNPVIWWGGLIAVGATVRRWAMGGSAEILLMPALWAGAFLPYAATARSQGYFFYYVPASVFLAGALAGALARPSGRFWQRDTTFVAAAAAMFVYFYPILSAARLPEEMAFRQYMLLPSWP